MEYYDYTLTAEERNFYYDQGLSPIRVPVGYVSAGLVVIEDEHVNNSNWYFAPYSGGRVGGTKATLINDVFNSMQGHKRLLFRKTDSLDKVVLSQVSNNTMFRGRLSGTDGVGVYIKAKDVLVRLHSDGHITSQRYSNLMANSIFIEQYEELLPEVA